MAGLGLLLALVALWWWAPYLSLDADQRAVRFERAERLRLAKRGELLPGTPELGNLSARLKAQGLRLGAPIFIRVFKREFELELWVENGGRYQRFATYPICRWSGELGPKLIEGDGQSPEGFYTVDQRALNPNSRWHRSFNLGFPNAFDRAHGRTGSFLMVHGGCSSIGCYAMTNAVMDEIWRLIGAALGGGQRQVHVHAFPFRMTADNLAARQGSPWRAFWQDLKAGYDAFETTKIPPRVMVCNGSYQVTPIDRKRRANRPIHHACLRQSANHKDLSEKL